MNILPVYQKKKGIDMQYVEKFQILHEINSYFCQLRQKVTEYCLGIIDCDLPGVACLFKVVIFFVPF